MPTAGVIEIDAGDVLAATSAALPLIERNVRNAMGVIGWTIASDAKADHDYQDRTGDLTRSITDTEPKGSLFEGNMYVDFRAGGLQVKYARYIEFGTKHIRPRMFMTNAVNRNVQFAVNQIQSALDDALDQAGL